ncbi:DMT family transporter [Gordonia insulae]|uniref:Putative cystine transporter YijE n=1 Tax=Gordonia insulae TaxID=2420509 RepID=A0A3G8JRD0_9ACTN|nr:DMT family transporter [Gordonia insulae]AZG47493.1 putative cystine transporter YijE [Gordonia insulae]
MLMRTSAPPAGPAVAASVTVALWASAFVVIRDLGPVFSPGAMAFLRLLFGVAALTVILVISRRRTATAASRAPRWPRGRGLGLVIAYGVAWFGAYSVVLNWAEQHLDAGTAALLVNLAPIIVAVYAGFFLGEGFSRMLVLGIVISFSGVVLITVGGGGAHADWLGLALGVITAVLYAAGVLLQKVALRDVDAVTATWLGAVAGLVATLPFAPTAFRELGAADPGQIAWLVFLGVGPTAIAFTTWAYALARTDAGALAATTLAVPAIVIVMSWLFLGELPSAVRIVGGVLCLAGVAIGRGLLRIRSRRVVGTEVRDVLGDEGASGAEGSGAGGSGAGGSDAGVSGAARTR